MPHVLDSLQDLALQNSELIFSSCPDTSKKPAFEGFNARDLTFPSARGSSFLDQSFLYL